MRRLKATDRPCHFSHVTTQRSSVRHERSLRLALPVAVAVAPAHYVPDSGLKLKARDERAARDRPAAGDSGEARAA